MRYTLLSADAALLVDIRPVGRIPLADLAALTGDQDSDAA
jgi:hypothetical protein